MRPLTAIAAAAILALTGCSADDESNDYYDTVRSLPGFEDATTEDLDALADRACDLIDQAADAGISNEDAVDAVYRSFLAAPMSEAEALLGTLALVANNCPVDISK